MNDSNRVPARRGLTPLGEARARAGHPRDSQKRRVYAAEREAFKDMPAHASIPSAKFVREFLRAANSRAIEQGASVRSEIPEVTVSSRARGSHFNNNFGIRIGTDHHLKRWVWIHELAHAVVPDRRSIAGHGPEFCRAYLSLVGAAFGSSGRDLLAHSFDEFGVKWRLPRVLTPKRQAELREQGKRLAALRHGRAVESAAVLADRWAEEVTS